MTPLPRNAFSALRSQPCRKRNQEQKTTTSLTDQSVALAEFAATALTSAEQSGVRKKPIPDFPLDETERAIAADLSDFSATLQKKLKKTTGTFTVTDTATIVMAIAASLLECAPRQRLKLRSIATKLMDCLQASMAPAAPAVPARVSARQSKPKYPLCLEGARACPPEDCGGVGGYGEFLEAIRNPKHEDHENMREWIGGGFDPDEFDAKQATKEMRTGLPDWRSMR